MASAFLSSILSKTSQLLGSVHRWAVSTSSSSDPRSSILKDLKRLERTLKRIQTVLHDAEEREIREEAIKLWLKELKEVAYDAEDVLDEYHYEELRAQVEARASRKRKRVEGDDEEEVSSSLSTIEVSIPDGMGDRIREIRERFDEISEDRERLRLREEDGERRVFGALRPPPTSHMVDESSIYGREHDKQKVIDLLFSEGMGSGISVIPIVGKGGLGKTTIAQLVYNDSKVKERFDLTGWVCISDDFDVPRLTKAIIESLTKISCDLTPLSTLQVTLKENVKGKRVLLVLDDVWNEQQSLWESLRIPFLGAETVRIIVTCRNDSVAEIMQTVHPYHPGYLSEDDSWSLFEHYAFAGRESEEQSRLADIGKQIVEKCSGLPLAVKTMGSLLRHEIDEDSWMDVLQSDLWELDKDNETLASLRLSYNRMPPHLKPCFIYCSMFPKDYVFDRDVLVRLWMAQGYIPPQGRKTMEDIGDECFNDLLRRSFFDSFNYVGHSRFKMHDMIHDLAKLIAGNECYTIVDNWLPCFPDGVRHLYIQGEEELVKSLCSQNLRALRTLLVSARFGSIYRMIKEVTQFSLLLLRTECLRTLTFVWKSEDELPDSISNLKHLRCLHITSKFIKKLPGSVCLLYHLQTLILECDALAELPSGTGNLINLRYFRLQTHCIKRLPESVCQLRSLQTLDLHWCNKLKGIMSGIGILTNAQILCLPAGIKKLTNLQRLCGRYEVQGGIGVLKDLVNLQGDLCISGLRNLVSIEDAKDVGLKYKHKLKRLYLFWDANCEHDWYYDGLDLKAFLEENKDVPAYEKREEAVLEYLQPPANLKKLLINGYGGSIFPEWVGNPLSFASLQEIHIIGCQSVWSLPLFIHDSLGKLDASISKSMIERVSISCCQQLKYIAGLHNLYSLKELKISVCPRLLILSEEGLPSKLQKLHIEECQRLTSLPGMQTLTSLQALIIKNCPQLRFLSEEGLPTNLQDLHIEKCQRLISLRGMQNLTSLELLTIINCPQLRLLSEERLPTNLQDLHIKECQQLISLRGMQNLTSLELLTIINCPQLLLLAEEGLPSKLESLHIEECQQLTSLSGMQNLTSLRELTIQNCPKLCIHVEDQLSSMPHHVDIIDCPGLVNWCEIQKINCIQVVSGNKLTISNSWEKIMHGFHDLTSTEHRFDESSTSRVALLQPRSHLFFSNSWESFIKRPQAKLEELTIWSCMHILPLEGLPELTSLQRLIIKDCPGVRLLRDEVLPSMLKSLVLDSCENLRCLQLVQQNRYALEELQIVNCPEIVMVQGLDRLFFPKFLTIERCPQLLLSQDDWRPFIHPCAEIAGELEMKFNPPHSEETENKETIDDGTQEKQVLNCVMIERPNSVVSSRFDAADDCNMGQFLQLGLPSGCRSQCPVQNNAEPLWVDNNAVSPMFDDAADCNMGQFLQLGLPSEGVVSQIGNSNTMGSDRSIFRQGACGNDVLRDGRQ
ncbi:putative disease resistance protein RGA3 isoform X4 [Elaeis guineensis]